MPTISEFYGIKITFRFDDHLPPHIHAEHDNNNAMVEISTGVILAGSLKPHAAGLVKEWVKLHSAELQEIWDKQKTIKIDPLD